jgi:gentisate 1,2-dioxygenase
VTSTEVRPEDVQLPFGMLFHDRLGLIIDAMVGRQLVDHTTLLRPTRHFPTATFDSMSGNTMLAMHLANIEVGVVKCDHRHLDETATFILKGRGFSEFRQADDGEPQRVEWEAGDLLVIPTNAWHRHVNTENTDARQISFRTTRLMNSIMHGGAGHYDKAEDIYHQGARFRDRFNDEPGYFSRRDELEPGRVRTNFVKQVVDQPVPTDDDEYGDGVAIQAFSMGGQRITDLAVAQIRSGGHMRPHRPIAEESFVVLSGSGRTDIWVENGPRRTVRWTAGDLISAPLGSWRQHIADGPEDVRLLLARSTVIERALGLTDQDTRWKLDVAHEDRFTALVASGLADAESR